MHCHIICFGNGFHGDDAVGIRIYQALTQLAWPAGVQIFEAGIAGLNALRLFEACNQALIIDAYHNPEMPGAVELFDLARLSGLSPVNNGHAAGIDFLIQALLTSDTPLPEIRMVGVGIAGVSPFTSQLTRSVELAIPKAVQLIRQVITP